MTRAHVIEAMTAARVLFPSLRLPTDADSFEFAADMWERTLGDLDQALVLAVLQAASVEPGRQFCPTPGEIRQRTAAILDPGGRAPSLDEAWRQVKHQIRAAGWCGTPTFTHPAIAAVVDAITWQALCESTNEIADRAHFARMYEQRVNDDRATIAIPPAARAVLEQHTPAAVLAAAPTPQLVPADREPVVAGAEARLRLRNEIARIRLAHDAADEDTAPARASFVKWQEGDPIDVAARGAKIDGGGAPDREAGDRGQADATAPAGSSDASTVGQPVSPGHTAEVAL